VFGEASFQMFGVFDVNIFYAEVVNDEGECEGSGIMLPKAWCVFGWSVAVGRESFREEAVGSFSSLFKAVDCLAKFYIYVAVADLIVQVVGLDDLIRDHPDREFQVEC
jgi:hypothetical protein